MEIKIDTNAIEISGHLSRLANSQISYAISTAVNAIAKAARNREHKDIPEYFDLRGNWLRKSGSMQVVYSRKTQRPNPFAIIGVADEVAALNAVGGRRNQNNRSMAVPLSDAGNGQSARKILNPGTGILSPSKWPSRILKKAPKRRVANSSGMVLLNKAPSPFILTTKSGNSFVAQRLSKDNPRLEFLYSFQKQVDVKNTWPLLPNIEAFVDRNYQRVFFIALDQAIKTAR